MSTIISRTVTGETEGYSSSVAGLDIEAVQAGPEMGPTEVLAAAGDRFAFTASRVGTPMITRATVPDDKVLVGYARSAPPGSRWCGIELQAGSVVRYASVVEHTSPPQSGLDYMFAIADWDHLEQHAEVLGVTLRPPRRGDAREVPPSATTAFIADAFEAFAGAAASGSYPPTEVGDDVLRALVHGYSPGAVPPAGDGKRIDPRHIVHACIDYADSVERIPSISELCVAAHVSERCLRGAFVQQFDASPTRYFRAWALEIAHRRLLHAGGDDLTVTEVATSVGWYHLGRFAIGYKAIYGESPAATLRAATNR